VATSTHIDLQVARNILAGDDRAFRELLDHFFPRLYRFAQVRLDHDDEAAADVVQQTTVDALPLHYGDVLEWKYVDGLSATL